MAPLILVVEDEPGIVDVLERGLKAHSFDVVSALDGESGLARAVEPDVDLVVLDLMLPLLSGEEVLRRLSTQRPDLPVIILTAKSELEDRIAGLDAGAVGYVTKPFSLAELAARIRAQLRATTGEHTVLRNSGIEVDLISRKVRADGAQVRLTNTEFDLLVHFMRYSGQVLSREHLLRAVWSDAYDPDTNVVDVYIGYLRRKLATPTLPAPIKTVRSAGYLFGRRPGDK